MSEPFSMEDADREVARILSLSDEEILAETIAAGLDPHEEAEKCRAIFRRAVERVRVNSPPSIPSAPQPPEPCQD